MNRYTICVVRMDGTDLFSAVLAEDPIGCPDSLAVPPHAERTDVELYTVASDALGLASLRGWVTRDQADAWIRALGESRRIG